MCDPINSGLRFHPGKYIEDVVYIVANVLTNRSQTKMLEVRFSFWRMEDGQ